MQRPGLHILALSLALGTAEAGPAQAPALAKSVTTDNLTVYSGTRATSPEQALRDNAERFGLPAGLENLVLVQVKESLLGKHYHYQQMLLDLPVDGAEIVVSIGKDGQLLQIYNSSRHVSADMEEDAVNQLHLKAQLSSESALDRAWANMRVQNPLVDLPKSEQVWIPGKDGFQLSYKVSIAAQMPTGGFVQYINAQDGSLIDSYSTSMPRNGKFEERTLAERQRTLGSPLNRKAETAAIERQKRLAKSVASPTPTFVNGSGFVFDPDPRTTLNNDSLTDSSAASAFDAAYFNKPLRDITLSGGVYSLAGAYVNITDIESPNTAPSTTTNGAWTAKRGSDAFDDTNTYFQLDQNQRYIQSLGFTNIINRPLDVDTNGVDGDDNSHYSYGGTTDYLAFGHGCVNDSEDADVILHEYGHGIQHNINSSWSGGDTGAMGEGFGDYWAGSYSYSTPNGPTYHPEWVFSWDGHSDCWSGRALNRTDAKYNSSKTYGAHQSITEGGVTFQSDELWSAPLFQALTSLMASGKSRANVDKIILQAHFGLGSGVKMPAMATAIVNAAHTLFPNDTTYENTFRTKFQAQNILTSVITGPTINETESNNTQATANVISTSGTTVNAAMATSSDVDFFKVTLAAGKTLTATMTPNSTSDYDLYLISSTGTQLAQSIKGTGQADVVSRSNTGTTSVDLYVKVIYYTGGTGSTNGKYSLVTAW
ncbi:M4 family metallopeptidase [Hyalangium versicolor]|uniref:M4 family metallopeptidase n=1 Tax=Hyalangium versicolor TaxID=2861190 RepID=UPI001CCCA75E|nr:M4 family metallopeptidase [Hyalangium versicolor]